MQHNKPASLYCLRENERGFIACDNMNVTIADVTLRNFEQTTNSATLSKIAGTQSWEIKRTENKSRSVAEYPNLRNKQKFDSFH